MTHEDSSPLKEFKDLFYPIKDKFEQLPIALLGLLKHSEELEENASTYEEKNKTLEAKMSEITKNHKGSETKITTLEKENTEYKEKLKSVEDKMANFRKMYEDLSQEKEKEIDIEELLAIYSILFENVFAANPHTKILLMLQGTQKEVWNRNEIVLATGFSPAAILKALHDLRNNGLIELDEADQEIRLVKSLV